MMRYDAKETEELDSQWPTGMDRAFLEVHPLQGAIVAEQTEERVSRIIKGYCEAGHSLVEQSDAEPYLRRNFLYPILFLYRQSIESHLKYLLLAYGPLAGEKGNFRSHDLMGLWSSCKSIIQFFDCNTEPADKETVQAVECHIAEFDAIDPRSDAWRFAHDTRGRPIKLPMGTIDLLNLRRVVASIHNFLECVNWQLRYGYSITPCKY